MNKFNLNKRIGAALSVALLAMALSGCGNDDSGSNGVGGPVGPGTVINGQVKNPDGSTTISFSGTGQSINGSRILAGTMPASMGNMACAPSFACFQKALCRLYGYTGMGCTAQEGYEVLGHSFGSIGLGSVAAVGAAVQKYDKAYYQVDGGRTNVAISVSGWGGAATVSGVINLSPQFVQYELGGQNVVGLGLDIYPQGGNIGGIIFTLINSASGSFIAF